MARARWLAVDAAYFESPTVEELGETHGPPGPLVFTALLTEAAQAGWGGRVRTTRRRLSQLTYTTPEIVGEVIRHAAAIGSLEVVELDERRVEVQLVNWKVWQDRARKTVEKADQRHGQE